jgi:Animal haem peroxidase
MYSIHTSEKLVWPTPSLSSRVACIPPFVRIQGSSLMVRHARILLIIALLSRTQFKPHPNQISSLFYYMVVIVSHGNPDYMSALNVDLFHTSYQDVNINMASSYLDLSPLYGSSQAEQNLIRTFKYGTLKQDTYSDRRLEVFPPGVAGLMICFNRFHNYVVQQLALINEGGRFATPSQSSIAATIRGTNNTMAEEQIEMEVQRAYTAAMTEVDNNLFHTARL